jgi:hypothetical protein
MDFTLEEALEFIIELILMSGLLGLMIYFYVNVERF